MWWSCHASFENFRDINTSRLTIIIASSFPRTWPTKLISFVLPWATQRVPYIEQGNPSQAHVIISGFWWISFARSLKVFYVWVCILYFFFWLCFGFFFLMILSVYLWVWISLFIFCLSLTSCKIEPTEKFPE